MVEKDEIVEIVIVRENFNFDNVKVLVYFENRIAGVFLFEKKVQIFKRNQENIEKEKVV